MDLFKQLAEAYILRTIGELDATTSEKLLTRLVEQGYPCASVKEALDYYEAEKSVRVYAVEWIMESWEQTRDETPQAFAKRIAPDFMETVD